MLEPHLDEDKERVQTPLVLVATLVEGTTLYAIERVEQGLYALCKLQHGIDVDGVDAIDPSSTTVARGTTLTIEGPAARTPRPWWQSAAVEHHVRPSRPQGLFAGPKLSMAQAEDWPPQTEATVTGTQPQPCCNGANPVVVSKQANAHHILAEPSAASAEEAFLAFVGQYLDALYLSKTSLAYLTKGPLSRLRSSFLPVSYGSLPLTELVDFLRSIVPSLASTETKYNSSLPDAIKECSMENGGKETPTAKSCKSKKRRKSHKPGKNGMYPNEADFVRQWWASVVAQHFEGDRSSDSFLKSRLAELRSRETFAQVILIMEVLALEKVMMLAPEENLDVVATNSEAAVAPLDAAGAKKPRKKKQQDFELLLDLLVDKLCIWQSIEQEQSTPKKVIEETLTPTMGHSESEDKLKSFCTEVVIPFYLSRLPEQAAVMNKKLGGPTLLSPRKRSVKQKESSKKRPGEPTDRPAPARKERRPLQRISTENLGHHTAKAPSLSRSATDSAVIPGLKRETSVTPLSAVPPASARPSSMSQYQRFNQRQVDLTALTSANEAKMKKKTLIEEELRNAISTLKKPNRGLAVKDFVDSADVRMQASAGRSRKSTHTVRKAPNSVEIMATPHRGRKSKSLADGGPRYEVPEGEEETAIQQSSHTRIMSSTFRTQHSSKPASAVPDSVAKPLGPRSRPAMDETPSRRSAKTVTFFSQGNDSGLVAGTPSRQSALHRMSDFEALTSTLSTTPTRSIRFSTVSDTPLKQNDVSVFATPAKPGLSERSVDRAEEEEPDKTLAEPSIYDALGWGNDVDELAL